MDAEVRLTLPRQASPWFLRSRPAYSRSRKCVRKSVGRSHEVSARESPVRAPSAHLVDLLERDALQDVELTSCRPVRTIHPPGCARSELGSRGTGQSSLTGPCSAAVRHRHDVGDDQRAQRHAGGRMHANRISESPRRKLGGVVDALRGARVNEGLNVAER